MCILLALRRRQTEAELWLAANRDEKLDRPWAPPRLLLDEPPVLGGRDLVGGGSWLAVNLAAGFVVGVTNAGLGALPGARSRGALVLDLAAEESLHTAVALLSELDLTAYGAFNLMAVDAQACCLATNVPEASLKAAGGQVTALGNDPLAAPRERVTATSERIAALAAADGAMLLRELADLLADHGGEDPLCRHGERYGTVCSTILALRGTSLVEYRFACGPPCTTPFTSLLPLAGLSTIES
jgi:uncharacterized protein with NRDE domain